MLLRNHPLVSQGTVSSWPPTWRWVAGSDDQHPQGEIGILKAVSRSDIGPTSSRCFLYIDHEGSSYIGCLICGDHAFCNQLVKVLEANRNKTIADIGSLDLTFAL
jgi:hypothetical protein